MSETFSDVGNRHEEYRNVCTGTPLKIHAETEVKLQPIPKQALIKKADALLKRISTRDDAWTLRTTIRSLWPYQDDSDVHDLCKRAETVIEDYVAANRKPKRPSLRDIEQMFDRI